MLTGASPNPFNPSTTIAFTLQAAGRARLVVFDAAGRQVRTLVDETRPAGRHEVRWDGVDDRGRQVSSGVHFCRMEAGSFRDTKRMTLVQ
jgi:flagellar hook assembly protein FlgD